MLAARSELLGRAEHMWPRQLQAFRPPASPPHMLCRVSHGFCLSSCLVSAHPGAGWCCLFLREVSFTALTGPCLYGSAMFAESLAPGVCGILRFMTVNLAYRSHHSTFAKPEGPARQHLPVWWDNWVPLLSWADGFPMFPMLDIPHSVLAHLYLTFLLGLILYLSLSCLGLLLLVLTRLSPSYSFPPRGISYVFTYLLYPVSPLHPVHLTPATTTPCNRETNVIFFIVS